MARAGIAGRRAKRQAYKAAVKSSKPGGGARFKALAAAAKAGGAKNPGAVAAIIGRKKYGQKNMTNWSVQGRKHSK